MDDWRGEGDWRVGAFRVGGFGYWGFWGGGFVSGLDKHPARQLERCGVFSCRDP